MPHATEINGMLRSLEKVERLAKGNKLKRFLFRPFSYVMAQLHRHVIYQVSERPFKTSCRTFWGAHFQILLPASMDIFLTGGKTHDSEIRLARYAIRHVESGSVVIDVGAHFGYYTLLFSRLAAKGRVFSFEASASSYNVLRENISSVANCVASPFLVSDTEQLQEFYEFPVQFSEYNSIDREQFSNEAWLKDTRVNAVWREAVTIDLFCIRNNVIPDLIKIDVEGAEWNVIKGASEILKNNRVIVVMEFLSAERSNDSHLKAAAMLEQLGYRSFAIDAEGNTYPVEDVLAHLSRVRLDSDNIVYLHWDG